MAMSEECYLIAAKRTPVVPRGGALAHLTLHELASPVIQSLFQTTGIEPANVDELIAGNALGAGGNPARVIALASGLNESVAGLSIDRQCCSGLDAIMLGKDMINAGRASVVIAGGVESYSQRPLRYSMTDNSTDPQPYDQPPFTPWPERDPDMAEAASVLAIELGISFDEQNQWAIHSHEKARAAMQSMQTEMIQLAGVNTDSFTRTLSARVCQRANRIHGSISVANAAVAADAAAFCLLVSTSVANTIAVPAMLVAAGTCIGANPELPGLAPVTAIESALKLEGIQAADLDCVEIMEAYAVQAMACIQQTGIEESICNRGGGALARGHPIGASGAVLLTRLFTELSHRPGTGMAAIAAAGGLGSALILKNG